MPVIFNYACAFAAVFIASVAQILLKKSAVRVASGEPIPLLKKFLNFRVIFSYFLMFCSLIVNVYAFTKIELKYAHIFDVSSIIWVTLLAAMLLGERPNKRRIIAIVLIVTGSVVFCL